MRNILNTNDDDGGQHPTAGGGTLVHVSHFICNQFHYCTIVLRTRWIGKSRLPLLQAAMGACYALTKHDPWCNNEQNRSQHHDEHGHDEVDFMTAEGVQNTAVVKGKDVELGMKHDLKEVLCIDKIGS
jgi:hypothetical protein